MKSIFHRACLTIVLACMCMCLLQAVQCKEPTVLNYYIEHEVEHESDYIEIGITVNSEERNLKNAIQKAKEVVDKLQKIAVNFCKQNSKDDSQCEEAFESSSYQIQPKYQMVRKVETFMAFAVEHKITIKVTELDGIGKMSDLLLKEGAELITIDSFDWKANHEQDPERQAVKSGFEEGQELCERMGLKLKRILTIDEVEEVEEEGEDGEEEEGGDEQQADEEEDAEVVIFRFEVECE